MKERLVAHNGDEHTLASTREAVAEFNRVVDSGDEEAIRVIRMRLNAAHKRLIDRVEVDAEKPVPDGIKVQAKEALTGVFWCGKGIGQVESGSSAEA